MSQSDGSRRFSLRERPVIISVFGILNLSFGVLGILGALGGLAVILAQRQGQGANPIVEAARRYPEYGLQLRLLQITGLVLACALIAAGIGLLQLKLWGRALSIACALLKIAFAVIASYVNAVYLLPLVQDVLLQHPAGEALSPDEIGVIVGASAGVLGSGGGVIYPLLLLIFMLLPRVKFALQPHAPCSLDRV